MCMCAAPQADEHNVATSCAPRKHTVCKFIIILRRVWNSKRMRFHTNRMMRCVLAECVFSFLIFVVVDVCINYTKCIQQAAAEKEKKQQTQNWTDGFTNSITRPLIQSPKKGKMQIWLNECIVHGVRRINAKRLILLHHTHFIGLIQITCYHFIIGITGFKINDAMHLWMELQSIGRFASITMYWVLCGTWVHFGIITDGNRRRVMLILWIPFN